MVGEEVVRVAKDIETSPYGSISGAQRLISLPGKIRQRRGLRLFTTVWGQNVLMTVWQYVRHQSFLRALSLIRLENGCILIWR